MNIANKTVLVLIAFALVPLTLAAVFAYEIEKRQIGITQAQLADMQSAFLLFAFMIALLSIFAGLFMAKRLTDPLRLLAAAVADFAVHPDKPLPPLLAAASRDDEVGIVWNEFHVMSEKILHYHQDLEDEVKKRTEELESFSYSVSHDLRAPLRAMDGFVKMLEEEYSASFDEEGKRMLAVIHTNAKQMGKLIDDLLAFSRLGRQEIKKAPVAMEALVRSVEGDLQPSGSDRGADIRIGDLPDAHADASMIQLVWTNLLSNALKFSRSREKARIEIGGRVEGDHVVYFIRDNGVGFDMKYVDKLFNVFQRLHAVKDFEGTGIGLANVKRIVERHGGEVRAEGVVDEGAAFYFTLPTSGSGTT